MSPKEIYREASALLRQLPVFCQPWWMDLVAPNWDVALVEENKKIVAAYPFRKEKKLGVSLIRPPLLTAYHAPFFTGNNISKNEALLRTLFSIIPEKGFHRLITYPGENTAAYDSLKGYTKKEQVTYRIDLAATETEIRKAMDGKRRNDINKAASLLTVTDAAPDFNAYFEWQQRLFKDKKVHFPYSKNFFEKLYHTITGHRSGFCLHAEAANGHRVATIWLVYDANAMYYILSAQHPGSRHRGAVSLLIREAILRAKRSGLTVFDFEGSMDPGIAKFFGKFGAAPVPYFIFEKNNSLLWQVKRKLLG